MWDVISLVDLLSLVFLVSTFETAVPILSSSLTKSYKWKLAGTLCLAAVAGIDGMISRISRMLKEENGVVCKLDWLTACVKWAIREEQMVIILYIKTCTSI